MSTAGGSTWDSAGTLTILSTTPPTRRTDLVAGDGTGAAPFGDSAYWPCWWTLTVSVDSWVTLDGTPCTAEVPVDGLDPDLWVFTGADYASRATYTYDYDSAGDHKPKKSFIASAGVVYHVLMGTYDSAGGGIATYGLTVTGVALVVPANDNLANAIPLVMDTLVDVLVPLATIETGEAAVTGPWTHRSIWYSLTAPFTGKFGADTFECDSTDGNSPEWTLWTGTGFGDLTRIAVGYGPDMVTDVVEGRSYLLRIAAQDEVTDVITFRFRKYVWSDWVQDPDVVQPSSFAFEIRGTGGDSDEADGALGSSPSTATLDAWANAQASTQWDQMTSTVFNGYDDAWITTSVIHSTGDTTQRYAAHEWSEVVKFFTSGFSGVGGQASMSQLLVTAVGVRGVPPILSTSARLEYESPDSKVVGAHLVVTYSARKSDTEVSWDGEYSVKAYWPTTSDLSIMDHPFTARTLVGPTSLSSTVVTGTTTLDLTEADLAGAESQYSGVLLWGPLVTAGPPTASGSFVGMNSGAALRTDVTVDQSNSNWTFRPPRRRTLSALIVDPPPPPPLIIAGQLDNTRVRPYPRKRR